MRARYYAPDQGRRTQRDPSGQDPDPYAFGDDNPVNVTDPTGECPICVQIAARSHACGLSCARYPPVATVPERFDSRGRAVRYGFHDYHGGPHQAPHIQVNYWRIGVKASGKAWRWFQP